MNSAIYDEIGRSYRVTRRSDPRIAALIRSSLGSAKSVVNVGAGAGSYEPSDRPVTAVEPSAVMIAQRQNPAVPVVQAVADALPFADRSFDAAMGVLTLHHWPDWRAGLSELKRVADSVVLLTWDPDGPGAWIAERYFPSFLGADRERFPTAVMLADELPGAAVHIVMVPADCEDGFLGAYWQRPRAYLDPVVRDGISSFADVSADDPRLVQLRQDLEDGTWEREFGWLRGESELDLGYRLVVANLRHPAPHPT